MMMTGASPPIRRWIDRRAVAAAAAAAAASCYPDQFKGVTRSATGRPDRRILPDDDRRPGQATGPVRILGEISIIII
jgi:hypothetical protein